jgi:hypothetical protein
MEDVGIFHSHLVYFRAIWYILWPFGIYCDHLAYFMVILYIFPRFGMFNEEKELNVVEKKLINSGLTAFECN